MTDPGDRMFVDGTLRPGEDRWPLVEDAIIPIEGEDTLYRRVVVETSVGPAASYEWMGATDGFAPLPDGWPPAT